MIDLRAESVAAVTAIQEALDMARLGTGGVHTKVGRDVVTDTDVAVEDHLRRSLTSAFGWPVIGEERGGTVPVDTPYWLVDPICGTRNFASAIPLYAVNAAMVENGRVTIAVVGDGSSGDVLVAEAGNGAWRLGQRGPVGLSTTPASLIIDFGANPKAGPDRDRAARVVAEAIRRDRWDVRCRSDRWLRPVRCPQLRPYRGGYVARRRSGRPGDGHRGCAVDARDVLAHLFGGRGLPPRGPGRRRPRDFL
jgi:fructose-1,6-bisphosphatase/inositol monophosphatase family enzyme